MKKKISVVLITMLSLSLIFSAPAGLFLFNAKAQSISNSPKPSSPLTTTTTANRINVPNINNPGNYPNSNIQTPIRPGVTNNPLVPSGISPFLNPNQQLQPQQTTTAVGRVPPDTQITSAIDGSGKPVQNGGPTSSNSMTFTFRGIDNTGGVLNFQCSLDNRPYTSCGSQVNLPGLNVRGHSFAVVAVDSAGNVDRSPAFFTWIVTQTQPQSSQQSTAASGAVSSPQQIQLHTTKKSSQVSRSANIVSSSSNCTADVCANPGDTVTIGVICSADNPEVVVTCKMISGPPGATFSSTTGNPAEGTMTWSKVGPPGTYQASFISICVFVPQGVRCLPSNVLTETILVNSPPVAIAKSIPDKTAEIKSSVTLDGSASFDPDKAQGDFIKTYAWKQTDNSDFPVSINQKDPSSPLADFISPDKVPFRFASEQTSPIKIPLTFSLVVTDSHGATSVDTPQSSVSILLKCSGADEMKCDTVSSDVQKIISRSKSLGFVEVPKRFQHWIAGSGTSMPLDVTWLRNTRSIQYAESNNQLRFEFNPKSEGSGNSLLKFAQTLKNGEVKSFSDKWATGLTVFQEAFVFGDYDLSAAVGTTQLTSNGIFQVIRQGPIYTVTGTVTHSIIDRFDFNPGDVFFVPILFPGSVKADDLNLLETCRGAMPFEQNAFYFQDVTFKGTIIQFGNHLNWHWGEAKTK